MSRKRARSQSPSHVPEDEISRSDAIEDRDSKFIGLYSPVLTAKALQDVADIRSATHRIAAWRKASSQRTIGHGHQQLFDVGHDDDGEKWAGKKLENLLSSLKVEGTVVVARWYGGVMLGPVRFQHIETCAREALSMWREAQEQLKKKQRMNEEELMLKQKLQETLIERDRSIDVLRGLLTSKITAKAGNADDSSPIVSQTSPKKIPDYSNMSLDALRRLEKARDATLSFVLKQLDKHDNLAQAEGRSAAGNTSGARDP